MGNEQSDNRRHQQTPSPQMSEDQVRRLLEAQRQQYERKLEELAAQRKQEEAAKAAQKKREEDAARIAAERRQAEEAARNSNLNYNIERDRAPYSYSGNQLQQTAASAPPRPLFNNVYPNLGPSNPNFGPSSPNFGPSSPNFGPSSPNFGTSGPNNGQYMNKNNNPFRPTNPNQEYVFVNKFGQSASYNRHSPGPVPSAPAPPRGPSPRTRSGSRPRNSPPERDVLDCPTCHLRYGLRIFQCDNGHSSCNDCKTRGRACGICRRPLTNLRNFEIENHVAQTKAPCPHSSEGCKLFIKIADMENHVKECPFKEQDCPLAAVFGTCRWKGKLSQISSHFENVHPSGCQTNVDSEMHLTNVRNNSQQVSLIVLGTYNFLLHVKVSETDGKVYMAVQLIGTKFSAAKWLYEIHVYNKSESRRKFMYTDNCCASMDKIEDVYNAGECAVLPIWHANTFVCNGVFTYKVFIKQTNEEKKAFVKNQRGKGRNHYNKN